MKMQQLKEELMRRGLPTTGKRLDLLIRLRDSMDQEVLYPENHEFDVKDLTMVVPAEEATGGVAPTNNFDMGQLKLMMQQIMEQYFGRIEQALANQATQLANHAAKQEELRQTLTQQIVAQNTEMKQALAEQGNRQEEIKQALVEQGNHHKIMNTELKDEKANYIGVDRAAIGARAQDGFVKIKCWRCGNMGHISRDCWQRAEATNIGMDRPQDGSNRSWKYGKRDHISRDCREWVESINTGIHQPAIRPRDGGGRISCWICGRKTAGK